MKKRYLFMLLRGVWAHPRGRSRLKVFAIVGVLGAILCGTVMIAGGIALYRAVAGFSQSIAVNTNLSPQQIKTEIVEVVPSQVWRCWNAAQALVLTDSWFQAPLGASFSSLKQACWGPGKENCSNNECSKLDIQNALDRRAT